MRQAVSHCVSVGGAGSSGSAVASLDLSELLLRRAIWARFSRGGDPPGQPLQDLVPQMQQFGGRGTAGAAWYPP